MHSATTPSTSTTTGAGAGAGAGPGQGGVSHSRTFSVASDGGNSVTGSFTGSLGGSTADGVFTTQQQQQQQQQQQKGGKKRGRKSKVEKEREREREREREDALSGFGGRGGEGLESRVGSVDGDGRSVRGGGAGTTTGGTGAGGGGGGDEGGDDEEDFDDEGELLGREEGATDAEAEKKNLAYVLWMLTTRAAVKLVD